MLENKQIQTSESLLTSLVVLVKKKNGKLYFCIDYRKLNRVTKKDAYSLPQIDEILDILAGSKWFSILDLAVDTSKYKYTQMIRKRLLS